MWEILLSLHALQVGTGAAVFGNWRRRTRAVVTPVVRPLLALAPPRGYSPDFLTPASQPTEVRSGIEQVLATSPERLRRDMTEFAMEHSLAPWMHSLGKGDTTALRHIGNALNAYYQQAIAPYWARISVEVEADRQRRGQVLTDGGPGALLRTLHPVLRWRGSVLSMPNTLGDRVLRLNGRGLLLVPSFFCWGRPTMLRDPTLPPVLIYPIVHTGDWTTPRADADLDRLAALLGRTRAAALNALSHGAHTTGELASILRISPGTASEHVTVLRNAGLAATHRVRNTAHHTLRPLGLELLAGANRLGPPQPASWLSDERQSDGGDTDVRT